MEIKEDLESILPCFCFIVVVYTCLILDLTPTFYREFETSYSHTLLEEGRDDIGDDDDDDEVLLQICSIGEENANLEDEAIRL